MLLNILASRNKITVLRELCQHENYQYSVTELAEKTKIHRVRLFTLLNELEQSGVVKSLRKGKVRLISVNNRNYYVRELLIKAFEMEKSVAIDAARKFTDKVDKKNVVSIVLYGSSVKKKFTFKSDLDIMIITSGKIDEEKISETAGKFLEKGILIMEDVNTLQEFHKLYEQKEPAIITLINDHLVLYGRQIIGVI